MSLPAKIVLILLAAGLTVALIGAGCTPTAVRQVTGEAAPQPEHRQASDVSPGKPQSDKLDWRAYNYFVNGLLYEGMGDLYNAALNYREALKYFPDSHEIGFTYALALFRMGEPKKSLGVLRKLSPQDVQVLELSARCFNRMGLPDSTRAVCLRLVDIEPDNSVAYSFLASYYGRLNHLDSTIWAYEQLTRVNPTSYRQLNELARLLVRRRDFDRAKAVFRQSMKAEFGRANMMAVVGLGESYLMTEQTDSAGLIFRRGLEVDPDNLVLHRELIAVYVRTDSALAAIPHAQRLVELSPLDRSASRRLGILYFSTDSMRLADSILTSLVESGDRNAFNHFYLGRIAAGRENWVRARDEFILETKLADTAFQSWLDLGMAYRRLDERDKEIKTYQTGLNHMRVEESAINLSFALGAAYEQAGQVEKAVATFEEIITHNPDHAPSLNYLGYMLADRNQRLEYARELIARALELAPDNAAYLDSYGWVYFRLGRYEEALTHLKKAVLLDIDPIIFDHLGDAYHALGQMELAREWWEKALQQQPDNEAIKEKLSR